MFNFSFSPQPNNFPNSHTKFLSLLFSFPFQDHDIRLVAVSKLKDFRFIQACYDVGYRNFGENYVQEMVDKAGKV